MARFVVGLTGGIGSGKSAVSDRFERLGVTVADTDVGSRAIVVPGAPALAGIVARFGPGILAADGTLDRRALRERVFGDPDERVWLERHLNPRIGRWLAERIAGAPSRYAVLVNPVLIETGQYRTCDRVLVVDAGEALQIERAASRDASDPARIRAIMAAQTSRSERLKRADDVITNDAGLDHLDREVARLHGHYLELAARVVE